MISTAVSVDNTLMMIVMLSVDDVDERQTEQDTEVHNVWWVLYCG